jgi:hypothetical protein
MSIKILYILYCAVILEQPVGARKRVGIGLSYRPSAGLNRLAELVPPPSLNVFYAVMNAQHLYRN